MTRRVLLALLAIAALTAAPPLAAAVKRSWAQREITLVTAKGVMTAPGGSFRPDDTLTQGELAGLVTALSGEPTRVPASPSSRVTIAQLDGQLVGALGLADEATLFARAARAAGLKPPARFGREVVARLLGLRYNHPAGEDDLELLWSDPATRAETAYSAAQILRFRGWETTSVEEQARQLVLPVLDDPQRQILDYAIGLVGYPYVWGGTSTTRQAPFGVKTSGGFDCSGFLWQVYKQHAYAGLEGLGTVIRGRTAAQMAGEVPVRETDPVRQAGAGRPAVLRVGRAARQGLLRRPCGHLPRLRLDGALLPLRGRARQGRGLVRGAVRVGPAAPRRSRPGLISEPVPRTTERPLPNHLMTREPRSDAGFRRVFRGSPFPPPLLPRSGQRERARSPTTGGRRRAPTSRCPGRCPVKRGTSPRERGTPRACGTPRAPLTSDPLGLGETGLHVKSQKPRESCAVQLAVDQLDYEQTVRAQAAGVPPVLSVERA